MNELDRKALTPAPTVNRPLLGLTVLVVEDSRYACEAMRLLCLRSGARIRRADCLRSARRHLQVYRPSIVIVDLGLPDGSGAELIDELNTCVPRVGALLGISGDETNEAVALASGADGFLAKPITSLAAFQSAVISMLPQTIRPMGVRSIVDDEVNPDPMAFHDDMAHIADLLATETDGKTLEYIARFLEGVALSANDSDLSTAAFNLRAARTEGRALHVHTARVAGLVQDRLADRMAI
ncbi:MAG: response regulator [Pseudomonadota bacterium]